MRNKYFENSVNVFVIFILVWTVLAGMLSDVIDVDAAQYASISMEMLLNETYLTVTERGSDYLDKPPFLFWINCISFKLFGFNNFAYKLPTLLFSLISLTYTYKLGIYFYDKKTGEVAAMILVSSIGFIWANNDIKTDAMITTCIIFSVYHLIIFLHKNTFINLIAASIGIGTGLLTKGPMGLIFPFVIFFVHAFIKREFRSLIRLSWIILIVIVCAILSPMLWGLYHQFDLHPEKIVNGKTGVSGVTFFLWEQSFGRITGENIWKNDTSFFYLFHSLILLMFPYSVVTLVAYLKKVKVVIGERNRAELNLVGSSLLILVALSLSSYKIPHYTIILFPYVSIIVASELVRTTQLESSRWLRVHNTMITILVFTISVISFLCFGFEWFLVLPVGLLLFIQVELLRRLLNIKSLFISALTLGFVFNVHLIPNIQKYSEGRRFAELITEKKLHNERLYFFNRNSRAMEFYLNKRLKVVSWEELFEINKSEHAWFYMSLDGKEALMNAGLQIEDELKLLQYDLNRIKLGFVNPLTRKKHLEPRFLIKFKNN